LNQSLLIEATRKARLVVTGYCGMAVGRSLADPLLAAIVVRQGGVVALSRTTDPGRIAENVVIATSRLRQWLKTGDSLVGFRTLEIKAV
jgi:2,5-diketo-D-gluconate reductase B